MDSFRIAVELGATVNIGNFNSVRVAYSQEAIVKPGDDLEKVRDKLFDEVEDYVNSKVTELRDE